MPFKILGNLKAKVLAIASAAALVFATGCSLSSDGQKANVSFCIDSNTAQEILSRVKSATETNDSARVAAEDLATAKITVNLTGDVEVSQTKDFTEQGVSFTFPRISIGASVSAQAQIYYVDEESNKIIISEGKSDEPIIVKAGSNAITLTLKILIEEKKEYNQVIQTDTTYTVINPIFVYQRADEDEPAEEMLTNEISFVHAKDYETCMWKPADDNIKIEDYQFAKITYKGTTLKTDEENVIAFAAVRSVSRNYYRDQKPVTNESQTYEMSIPQGKGPVAIGIENKWMVTETKNGWADDLSFEVEKIELIKNPELAINYNALTVTDNHPEILYNINASTDWSLGPNTIRYNSAGWAAAYWEFDRLAEYDKIAITVKGYDINDYGMKFQMSGYVPYYKANERRTDEEEARSQYTKWVGLDSDAIHENRTSESVKFVIDISELCKREVDGQTVSFAPTAIEFQNCSHEGDWTYNEETGEWSDADIVWGDDWTLEIEKIELIKIEQKAEKVIFDPNDSTLMSQVQYFDGADEYTDNDENKPTIVEHNGKKYLKVIPNEYNLNILFPEVDLTGYMYVKVEAYTEENNVSKRVGFVLRERTEETEGFCDQNLRTADDLDFKVMKKDNGQSLSGVITLSGVVGGLEKTNHLTAYVQDLDDNDSPLTNQVVYIGRIIATTNLDVEYDPFKVWEVNAKITLPEYNFGDDLQVTSQKVTDAGNEAYILTATAGYGTYVWKVNGVLQKETSNVFTFSLQDRPKDNYDITVLVEDQGLSSWAQVKVE